MTKPGSSRKYVLKPIKGIEYYTIKWYSPCVAREFLEASGFTKLVESGTITDNQLKRLQMDIMQGQGAVIPRTGGFKKIRLADHGRKGKSGSWRVIFADYPEYHFTAIVFAYHKNVQENLTALQEKQLRKIKREINAEAKRKYGKSKKE